MLTPDARITRITPRSDWPELLRVEEAATLLDISRGVAYDLVRRGELPSIRLGRLLRIPRSGLIAKMDGQ
jgi:excisionase family DNA binding protein